MSQPPEEMSEFVFQTKQWARQNKPPTNAARYDNATLHRYDDTAEREHGADRISDRTKQTEAQKRDNRIRQYQYYNSMDIAMADHKYNEEIRREMAKTQREEEQQRINELRRYQNELRIQQTNQNTTKFIEEQNLDAWANRFNQHGSNK